MSAQPQFGSTALARHHAKALGRVVVTGAGGFIGRRLVQLLAGAGADVTGWTRADLDLTDGAVVAQALAEQRPATVFHLAASGLVGQPDQARLVAENVAMCRNLAAAMEARSTLIYAGSVSEYGHGGVLEETSRCSPRTAYGQAKLAAGLAGAAATQARGVKFVHARLFGVYGPGEPEYRLFPAVLKALTENMPVALSDCRQQRDFVHVDDVCGALIALAGVGEAAALVNVGTGTALAVRDFVKWAAAALGAPPELLQFGARARSVHDEDLIVAGDARLVAAIGSRLTQRLSPQLDLALLQSIPVPGESACR